MCGIAGIVRKSREELDITSALGAMERAITHRGPNESGFHATDEFGCLNVRLSIVDIAGGHQPIFTANGKIGIVYNGEVYNFPELRADLEQKGYSFTTHSDTEVVLKLYEEYGTDAFAKLNGMFGLCIWDDRTDQLFIVRDGFGIKPLYVYEDDRQLVFCSELKGIMALPDLKLDLDPAGFQDYLTFRYMQAPYTQFKNIRRLEAGTYLVVKNRRATQFRYWDVDYSEAFPPVPVEEALEELGRLMQSAVSSQLMGEVPIGVLLSGGIDSSVIAHYVHTLGANLTTFNIGFPEVNEFQYSREVAKSFGLDHVEVTMSVAELVDLFDRIAFAIDEPIADPACFPLYRLCEELKKQVTVVLSGEGGDELFAGYPQYTQVVQSADQVPDTFSHFIERSWYFLDGFQYLRDQTIAPHTLRYRKYFADKPLLNGMLSYDMRTWMPDNLMMKADKILMAHSLEGRFPFLDKDVFQFSATLAQHYKLAEDGTQKYLLRRLAKTFLPESIIERPKMGFSVPVAEILHSLRPVVQETCEQLPGSQLDEVLDTTLIRNLVEGFYAGQEILPLRVWTLFVMCYWHLTVLPAWRKNL